MIYIQIMCSICFVYYENIFVKEYKFIIGTLKNIFVKGNRAIIDLMKRTSIAKVMKVTPV